MNLNEIDWIDNYCGGTLEQLQRKVERLENLVEILLNKNFADELEVQKALWEVLK